MFPLFPMRCRVAEKEPINKMSLHNLATVFGPTLLRPSEGESKGHLTLASDIWSHDVMAQVRAVPVARGCSPHQHPCVGSRGVCFVWVHLSLSAGCVCTTTSWEVAALPLFGLIPPVCLLQVQVLLYYLQHPPISFTELKRNTLYFSTDV